MPFVDKPMAVAAGQSQSMGFAGQSGSQALPPTYSKQLGSNHPPPQPDVSATAAELFSRIGDLRKAAAGDLGDVDD